MTDIRIVTSDGQRLEVSNSYLTPEHLKEVLFSRSGAPSKKEVKVESGRNFRKSYNNTRVMHRAQNQPQPPKTSTPRPAGGLVTTTPHHMDRLHDTSSSPFEQDHDDNIEKFDLHRRW